MAGSASGVAQVTKAPSPFRLAAKLEKRKAGGRAQRRKAEALARKGKKQGGK